MPHKKDNTLGFNNGRNELGGEVVDVRDHGTLFVEITLKLNPDELKRKVEREETEGEISIVMTKSKWKDLEKTLETEDGRTLALAVIAPTNVDLEVLRDDH